LEQGVLVANPVPPEHEIPARELRAHIDRALNELDAQGITGKEVTPFLLARIVGLTDGQALETNIQLLKNNILLACEIAICLAG
jgi:pseudouridine-5'-phosphate glycosidase